MCKGIVSQCKKPKGALTDTLCMSIVMCAPAEGIFCGRCIKMAIYHLSVKIIGRSSGRSVVAAAAYRSGTDLFDFETGTRCDYSRKFGVVYSEIDLPTNAPNNYCDREKLWNSVQKIENRSNSRLAREVEAALPKELSKGLQIQLVKEYVSDNFVSKGMVADWSIHDKGNGNPHAHILLTTRGFTPDGNWDCKEKKRYKLDENGERIPIMDQLTGEQKIGARGRKLWQRETVAANEWNNRENIEIWRENWADVCNSFLIPLEIDPIDHKSYVRQNIDQIPTIHEGYIARDMEAHGVISERCEINREIMGLNLFEKEVDYVDVDRQSKLDCEINSISNGEHHIEIDVKEDYGVSVEDSDYCGLEYEYNDY